MVPDLASVWYYSRKHGFQSVCTLYETGNEIAAAARATGTTVDYRVLDYAAPNFANRPLAEAAYTNIVTVGMPAWSIDD